MKRLLSGFMAGGLLWFAPIVSLFAAPAQVYLVIGSDTAIWNDGNTVDVYSPRPHYKPDMFTDPAGPAYQVMDATMRNQFKDSFGQPIKFTWWLMAGNIFRFADNVNVPIANTMNLYLMKKYHGDAIRQFGDELTLHYHTFLWSDYTGAGTYYWNQSRTFLECREDFYFTLAQYLLEENIFPVSFRSGWHFMDNDWQQCLNQLLPFSMHDNWPAYKPWYTNQPINNVQDWSVAPSVFIPYHPSSTNYQVPGDGPGWNVRSIKMQSLTQNTMNQIFAEAAGGTGQVACIWNHLPENYPLYLTNTVSLIEIAATNYPEARFHYCTAVEAMQRWLGQTNTEPLQLAVAESTQGQILTLTIQTTRPIFQPQPFVALRDVFQQYSVLSCSNAGPNQWTVTLPAPKNRIAKVGIAATDNLGNLATRVIRYLPDDLYIDNRDPQYAELDGNWLTMTSAAWGVDARVAPLTSNTTASVIWSLPVSWSGPYDLFIQVPAITNMAGQLTFNVYSGGSNVYSHFTQTALPPNQWVYLGTPILDQTTSNALVMVVRGPTQPHSFAVADVIKLAPNVLQVPGFISAVQVDSADTTACITWTTLAPATTLIEYGHDYGYGSVSFTNLSPVTQHVMTLEGLAPGANYYFQINSTANDTLYTYQGYFTTTNYAPITMLSRIFEVTNSWRFSTNNYDGIAWTAKDFDDSAWLGGPGLLWVDTRTNGPDPAVQPKNTPMPMNPVTGYPYTAYYFRTHFVFTNSTKALTFSNYIDDGAVFYLNGVEIQRDNMAPASSGVITNASLARKYNCDGDATCPVVFTVSGNLLTNLVAGDNVLAVEVHNYNVDSPDITFGSALFYSRPFAPTPRLQFLHATDGITLYWNGSGLILQQTSQLPGSDWQDTPGPITTSPYAAANPGTTFYRLRKADGN